MADLDMETKVKRIDLIDTEIQNLKTTISTLEIEKKDLVKVVRSHIKAQLKETADKYGFKIMNKGKSTKKTDTPTEE